MAYLALGVLLNGDESTQHVRAVRVLFSLRMRFADLRDRLNIPWYWFTNWIFGRDLSRF